MPLQRQVEPLPPGRYYTWQPRKKFKALHKWMARPGVTTSHSESDEHGEFIIFTTEEPMNYPKALGYPDFAAENVESAADTIEAPDPELDSLDQLWEAFKDVKDAARRGSNTLVWVGIAAAAVVTIAAAAKVSK